jgi:hypothetical protein
MTEYTEHHQHQGRWGYGKTLRETLVDRVLFAKEHMLAAGEDSLSVR